jgi:cytochrome c oxidase subunit 2
MSSADVIHSLYVPAFRIKRDVVPGRYAKAWFEATEPGEYDLFCAEYCGTSHSDMVAHVIVHPPGEFEVWLEKASNFLETMSPVDAGRKLFQVRGCTQCHSMDGSAKTGPTLLGVFGKVEQMADGSSVTVDENYIRESILEPTARVVAGFDPVMPTYQGRLKDEEIMAIIAYLKAPAGGSQEE